MAIFKVTFLGVFEVIFAFKVVSLKIALKILRVAWHPPEGNLGGRKSATGHSEGA